MNIRELLLTGKNELKKSSESPGLDANILLSHSLKMDRARLLAYYDEEVSEENQTLFFSYIKSRKEGYPVAYILGEKEFYGRPFHLEKGVLTPRPDTEIIVEKALELISENSLKNCLDMCTGTGCIAITIKLEAPSCEVTATDISPFAQKVFKKNNADLTDNSVNFIHSDLFTKLTDRKFDIIVTNPPYLTKQETEERMDDGWKEPELALDGGDDGLDLIRIIIDQAVNHLTPGGWLLIEAAPFQMEEMKLEMVKHGYNKIEIVNDLAGLGRVIAGRYE